MDLEYGDCGNLMVYCIRCEFSVGVNGEYINEEYDDNWVKNWDEYQRLHQDE